MTRETSRLSHGVKDERTTLYQEIEALSNRVKPLAGYDPQAGIAWVLYEIPDLHIRLGWHTPLRGFKITETDAKGTRTFLCATTLVETAADVIRCIVPLKWGIENNGNKDLKDK